MPSSQTYRMERVNVVNFQGFIEFFCYLFQPAQPRPAHVISGKVEPEMLAPIPYEFIA
jgi:hypothetical protein